MSFLCRLDGDAFATCTSPADYSNLSEGAHSFQVEARDAAGNESSAASYSWTVDTTPPPEPTIDSHPADPSNSASASFGFSGEAGASFLCSLDGVAFAACTSPAAYSNLSEGAHGFQVKARDAAGNESSAASYSWTVDTTPPPEPTIDSHPPDPSNSTSASFTFSGQAGVSFLCRLDGDAFATCTSPADYSNLSEGAHSFQVEARDDAGNESAATSYTWVMSIAPIVTLVTPGNGSSTDDATPVFSGRGGIGVGDAPTVGVKIYAGAMVIEPPLLTLVSIVDFAGLYSVDSTPLADGAYTAQAEQSGAEGMGFSTANTFEVDTTPPPAPTIDSHPPDPSNSTSASFTFSGQVGVSFLCSLDGVAFAACTSPAAYSNLSEGAHGFQVKARDAAGNEGSAASYGWTVDLAPPPAPVIDSHPPDPSNSTSASFTFSGQAGASFLCSLDGAPFAACTSPAAYSNLSEGAHGFQVKARDAAGNESAAAGYGWTVDTIAPALILRTPADLSTTSDSTPRFSGDAGSAPGDARTVTVRVYVGPDASGEPLQILTTTRQGGLFAVDASTPLADGTYTARAEQADVAGNGGMSAANSFVVDTTLPDTTSPAVTLTSPPDGSSTSDTTPTFAGVAGTDAGDEDMVSVAVYEGSMPVVPPVQTLFTTHDLLGSYAVDAAALAEGSYTAQAEQLDEAGNVGLSAAVSFTVDRDPPPSPTIDAHPPDPSNSTSAGFEFSGEPGASFLCSLDGADFAACTNPAAYASLSEGVHSFQVKARDAAGNESAAAGYGWTVDTTPPPAPSITSHPTDPSNSTSPSFGFSGEAGASFLCRLDGAAFAACTSPTAYSSLVEGAHSFQVKARDAAGNESGLASFAWTIDTTPPPAPSITSHPTDPSNSTSPSFGFSGEAGASFLCSLDGAAFATCTTPATYSNLSAGAHSFQVKARDVAGNESAAAAYGWTVDLTPPLVPTIDSHPPDPSNSTSASFGFSGEAGASFLCRLDGAAFAACTSPTAYSSLSEGAHSFQVKARDAAGNESVVASFTWTVDTTLPPAPTIDSHPPNPSDSSSASFDFSDGESGVSFLCRLDGAVFATCTSPAAYSSLADGSHSFQVKARDAAGNESSVAGFAWTVDTTPPPTPSITSHPTDPSNSTGASFGFSGEAGASFLCRLDGAAFASCTSPTAYANVPEGPHRFQVEARDAAGNESVAASSFWTVDTTPPPTPTINSHPPSSSNSTSASFGFSGQAGVDLLCRLDGAVFATCTSPAAYANVPEGPHRFQVEARDAAGNESVAASSFWTVDTTPPPAPTINSHPPSSSNSTGASFGFSGHTGASFFCRLDGAVFVPCTSPAAYSNLSEGAHTFQVKARDAAGNDSPAASFSWTIDVPPILTLTSPANGSSTGSSLPTFSGIAGTASGDNATVVVRVYAGSSPTGTPVQTLNATAQPNGVYSVVASHPLAEGQYTARAVQLDNRGNLGQSSANTFTVSTSYRAEVLADGPRAYWRLGEASGTAAADQAGGNTGTYTGGVTLGQPGALVGDGNLSASFDGVNDYVVVPDANALDATTGVTIEAWVKRTKTAYQVIVGKPGNGQSRFENYALWLDPSNQLIAYFGNGSGYVQVVTPPIDTSWHHIVASYDNAVARIYVDAALADSAASTIQMAANSSPLNIGRDDEGGGYSFGGRLDEIAIYGSALSGGRILAHYNAGLGIDASPPLVTLSSPASGSATSDSTPTFAGSASTDSGDSATVTVKLYAGGSATGTPLRTMSATRQAGGSYSVDASPALADGTYTAQAEQTDTAENIGRSSANTFSIDTVVPVPTLSTPANGSVKNPPPNFAGTGGNANGDAASVTVKVYAGASTGGALVRSLSAGIGAGGSFSVDSSPPLEVGTYTAQVEQFDAAGNLGRSAANTFTVTTADVTPPAITLTAPLNGSRTSDTTPTFSGSAGSAAGDLASVTVKLYAGSTPTGTPLQTLSTTRNGSGAFSVDAAALANGTFTARAEQSDTAGNLGQSAPATFAVDTVAPVIVLTTPANGGSTSNPRPAFAGTAGTAAGDLSSVTVKLYAGPNTNGTLLQSMAASVGGGGAYSVDALSNLQPGTYTARSEQADGAGNGGFSSANTFTLTDAPPVLLAAGDISTCGSGNPGANATALLLDQYPDATVVPAGDTAYDNGQPADFVCYDQTWGRAKNRSRPMVGDHEYATVAGGTPPGVGHFNYFHDQLIPFGAAAADPSRGWYSYDLGAWHVVTLNASCYFQLAPGCDAEAQEQWFEADLTAHPNECTLVFWHKPRFSSGSVQGNYLASQQLWETSYAHGVDVVLGGDDHDYERFARMGPGGAADPQYGVRQFVVGTGGYWTYPFGTIQPNSEARIADTWGVIKLTLRPGSYDWQFLPVAGSTLTDSGSESCHPPAPAAVGGPTVRSSSSSIGNHPTTSLVIAKPAGTVQGDLLLTIATHQGGAGTTMSPPAGWTAVSNSDYSDGTNARSRAWFKFAGAAEPASYTFTLNTGQAAAGGMLAITGARASPIDASLGQVTGANSRLITAPSITTSGPALLVYAAAVNAPVFFAPPPFMSERWDRRTAGQFNVSLETATQAIPSSGPTGTRTSYLLEGARGPAIQIAIAPAP